MTMADGPADEDEQVNFATAVDWFGAAIVLRPLETGRPQRGPMIFHVFRASQAPDCFAITATSDPAVLPHLPGGGGWTLFKRIPETGQPRVGFSEAEAKADIQKFGVHLLRINLNTLERVIPIAEAG